MAVSDRIIVMKNAEIAEDGTPADLYERPNSAFTADFICDATLLPVELARAGETINIVIDGWHLELPTGFATTGQANFVLRPRQLRLTREAAAHTLPAEVSYAAYLGNQVEYTLSTPLGKVFAVTVPDANPFQTGDHVHVSFDPTAEPVVST